MSEGNSKGWTFDALWLAFTELRAADLAAVKTATAAFEKRMDSTNEWRGALDDQTKQRATIQQVDALKEQFEQQVEALKGQFDKLEALIEAGRNKSAGVGYLWTVLAAVVVAVGVIVGIIVAVIGRGG